MRRVNGEIEKFQGSEGKKEDEEKKYLDVISNKNIKLSERVLIPVKQYPKFNFVGKLLGPRGNSLKRLQEETGAKMSILGKGSMRDKAKEEELRKSGEAKYAHLSDELHVLIEVFAPPGEAYSRMSHALEEIKKFLVPDYNDEIRQEQLRELSYLNGSEDSARGRGIRGRGIRVPPAAPSRGRGGAIPPPPPGRGAQAPRGAPVTRGALPVPPVARGVPTPRARGAPAVPGYRPPPPPAHEAYEEYFAIKISCHFVKTCKRILNHLGTLWTQMIIKTLLMRDDHFFLLLSGDAGVRFLHPRLDEVPKRPEEHRSPVEPSLSHQWREVCPPLEQGVPQRSRATDHPHHLHTRPMKNMDTMMDMGVNMMIQAMRHMITAMPPKHKGKSLYFNVAKNTFVS
ncbi:PREDICTED: KH domain-containing, RNA-binding, signal transduction-associated protein 2 [Calidris pugnax]|nr:PREDICTED: KH domain-containing, RNA-binding, signal transduction-associated protein 2 [Calidris pugnax]